jgi:hypothetical protein
VRQARVDNRSSASRSSSRLGELLPEFEFAERHFVRVDSPATALAAAKDATPAEMPFLRVLFGLRSLPAFVTRGRGLPREGGRSLAEQMIEWGFVVLVDEADELVLGFVGQPWKLTGGSMPRLDAAAWRSFQEPGYVKAVMNFRAAETGLETETRVRATDEQSRRQFARYWRLIRPFSGLIRRSWLRAAKRRAAR